VVERFFSQGSAATDLRGGGGYNSNFLHRSFLNLIVKNMNIVPLFPTLS